MKRKKSCKHSRVKTVTETRSEALNGPMNATYHYKVGFQNGMRRAAEKIRRDWVCSDCHAHMELPLMICAEADELEKGAEKR